jgi:hypothetical protein
MTFLQCPCDIPCDWLYRRMTSIHDIPSFLLYVSITYSSLRTSIRLKSALWTFNRTFIRLKSTLWAFIRLNSALWTFIRTFIRLKSAYSSFDHVDFVFSVERCASDVLDVVSHVLLVQFAPFLFYWACYIHNSMSDRYQTFPLGIGYFGSFPSTIPSTFPSTFVLTIHSLNSRISTTTWGISVILLAIVSGHYWV